MNTRVYEILVTARGGESRVARIYASSTDAAVRLALEEAGGGSTVKCLGSVALEPEVALAAPWANLENGGWGQ